MTITISELLADVDAALSIPDDDDLPRCGPGEICPSWLVHHTGMNKYAAARTCKRWLIEGKVKPAKILYTDVWGDARQIKGYRAVQAAASSG